jgi:glycosyltransferase involved in cell wall biosynthesis
MKKNIVKKFLKNLYYYLLIIRSGLFDESYYLKNNKDVDPKWGNPIIHYLEKGGFEGRDPGPNFSSSWYLETYRDVKKAKFNPLAHYLIFGKKEGRLPNKQQASWISASYSIVEKNREILNNPTGEWKSYLVNGNSRFNSQAPTVIIVSHESSLTGAPLLSLNIAQQINKSYNIITFLIKSGDLLEIFQKSSTLVISPPENTYIDTAIANEIINIILQRYKIKFAIVNSIESRFILQLLSSKFVPTIHLIHEFAAYTQPKYAFPEAALWSHKTIYSTLITYENALKIHPELAEKNVEILPQGKCIIPASTKEISRLENGEMQFSELLTSHANSTKPIIVLGAGFVYFRKGVDLFIACAAKIVKKIKNVNFIWIGDGYDPENDIAYSAYLAEQINRSGLENFVTFIESMADIEKAYKMADIFLLSSRLDPLPNVAIDAMFHKKPVLCFDQATGIAEILKDHGLEDVCVAKYMDIDDISSKIEDLIKSETFRNEVGEKSYQIAVNTFDMEKYVDKLEHIGLSLEEKTNQEQRDSVTIKDSGLARMDFFLTSHISSECAYSYYVRSWATGIARRKLFPGFHPGIYLDRHPQIQNKVDPLADYILQKQPDGPWIYPLITEKNKPNLNIKNKKIGLHIHAYYIDFLPEILDRLNQNTFHPDLLISLPENTPSGGVRKYLRNYNGKVVDISPVPNKGRDIGPFLTQFRDKILRHYEFIGHFHTKNTRSNIYTSMDKWKDFLLENLIGGKANMTDIILQNMIADPTIGMVFPDDPNIMGWDQNHQIALDLASKLEIDSLPRHFNFPVGTMFWARVDAIRNLFELNLDVNDFPKEPIPDDGTILHAIERLLPLISSKAGFRNVLTNIEGVTR